MEINMNKREIKKLSKKLNGSLRIHTKKVLSSSEMKKYSTPKKAPKGISYDKLFDAI